MAINKEYDDVQLDVKFTQASTRANLVSEENISVSFGKLAKWYEALVPSGGSSGQFLGWNSDGTAKWVSNPNSDTKVTDTVGTANTYYPAGLTGTSTATGTQVFDTSFKFIGTTGTTSAVGKAQLVLGNSTASGTANNKQGSLVVYGSTAYAHTIQGAPTAARTLTLPDKTGTFALTSDIPSVPTVNDAALTLKGAGTTVTTFSANAASPKSLDIVAGSNVTVTADATNSKISIASSHPTITKSTDTTSTASPAHGGTFTAVDSITRDSNGHVTKINTKTVTLPSDQNTDTLVSQAFATASYKRPLLMSYYKVGEEAGTAQVAYRNDSLYCNPSSGRIFATGFYTGGWDTSPASTSASLQANGLVLRAIKTYGDGHTLDYNRYVVRTYSGKTGLNTSDWSSNGMLVTVEGGGLTIVGGGESAASLAGLISDDYLPASGTPNSLDVNGDTTTGTGYLHTSLSGSSENLILSADTDIYFVTNANTIANRKAARLTSDLYFTPLSTNTGSIGTSTYQWNTIYGKTLYENGTSLASKYAAIGHIHTTTIAADSGTNQLTLAASTKYKLTAGETNFIFTTPPNTTYSAGTGLSLSGTTINHSNSVTAVTNYNKPYVKYDAQGHITGSSYWTATAAGTGGESGWVKVATMVHTANYDNTPIMLLVSQRGNTIAYKLHIVWKNASNTDPDLDKFQLSSDISINVSAYIKKSATSTWELYIKKMDNYDAIAMHLYAGKYFPDHMTWTWQDVQTAASAITGGTEATKLVPYNSYQSRTANTVLAAPNGSDGEATFRALVADDLPYASTSAYGITKLSSSTSSTSTTLAATPSAVKSAYDLAAGKSTVSFSRNLTSGTKVGTITIDGTATDLYCQTNTNTDTLVSQTFATADHNRPLLMSYYDTGVETTTAQVVHRNDALYFNPSGGVLRSPRLYLQTTGMPITINLDTLQPTAGENVNVLAVKYKNTNGTATHTVYPIGILGNDTTGSSATVNSGVRLGSTNGTTVVGAGESSVTFAAAQAKYNDENLYFVADGAVYMYTSCNNDSTTVTGPWRVGGFTTGTSAITSGRVMITDGTGGGFKASDYTIAKSVPSDAKFSDTTYSAGNHLTLSSTTFKVADYCKNLNGGDWNTASTNGWYMGSACTNAPDSNWWMGRVVAHNNKYCIQEVWNFNVSAPDNTNPDAMYMSHKRRWFRNENWGPWVDVSTPTPSAKVNCEWGTAASRTTNVTRGWMAYWDGSYQSSNHSSNLTYCNQGAFGTIVTKNTGDYVPNTQAGVIDAINLLSAATADPKLTDYYISQYADGASQDPVNNNYYRRPISKLWNTFRSLITVDTTGSGNAITAVSIANDGDNRKITFTKGTTFPTTNTTYTFATGDAVGQIKVTPSGGTATNYNINGIAAGTTSGTAKHLAYYSSATSITSGANLIYSIEDSTASTPRSRTILHLVGNQTVGNDAAALISGTKGVLSYGDGGPQINFSTSGTIGGAQDSAIIWTDNDSAASGASWHFVSSQTDWNVISKRFHARTGISIGTNLPQTSYNLYVNGTAFHSDSITFGNTTTPVSPALSIYTRTTSTYATLAKWSNGSTWGTRGAEIGYHNTGGDSTNPGTICILPYQTETNPWDGQVGLFIKKDHVYIDGVELSKSDHTHARKAIATDSSEDFASYSWHKFAEVTITSTNYDYVATFIVSSGFVVSNTYAAKKLGILTMHIRTGGSRVYSVGELEWLVAGSQIDPNNFVMVYTDTANTSCKVELWYKQAYRYEGYTFNVIDEHTRTVKNIYTMTLNDTAGHGSATYTAGTGTIISKLGKIKNAPGVYTVKGTQTASTSVWTGSIDVSELYDGLTIAYYLPYASTSTSVTLNLTLANGTKTGAINCYYTNASRITTHYGAGSTIILTYWSAGSISVSGTATTDNRWTRCDYNANSSVTQNFATGNTDRPLLMSYYAKGNTTTSAQVVYRNDTIYANPSTGTIHASTFDGDITSLAFHNVIYALGATSDTATFNGAETLITSLPSSSGTSTPSYQRVTTNGFIKNVVGNLKEPVLYDNTTNPTASATVTFNANLGTPKYLKLFITVVGSTAYGSGGVTNVVDIDPLQYANGCFVGHGSPGQYGVSTYLTYICIIHSTSSDSHTYNCLKATTLSLSSGNTPSTATATVYITKVIAVY